MDIKNITDHLSIPVKDLTNKDKRNLNKKTEHLKGRGFDYSAVDPKFWSSYYKQNIYIKNTK